MMAFLPMAFTMVEGTCAKRNEEHGTGMIYAIFKCGS